MKHSYTIYGTTYDTSKDVKGFYEKLADELETYRPNLDIRLVTVLETSRYLEFDFVVIKRKNLKDGYTSRVKEDVKRYCEKYEFAYSEYEHGYLINASTVPGVTTYLEQHYRVGKFIRHYPIKKPVYVQVGPGMAEGMEMEPF